MNDDWFTAAVPTGHTLCLKLKLRPYALGHEILLVRLGSPLAVGGPLRLPDDLILGAFLCSQTFEHAVESLHSPGLSLFFRLWRLRLRNVHWALELEIFNNYRRPALWLPETNVPLKGRPLKSPIAIQMAARLMRELHITESEALNFPLARATAYLHALGDYDGTVDLLGPAEEALLAKLAELDAAEGKEAMKS